MTKRFQYDVRFPNEVLDNGTLIHGESVVDLLNELATKCSKLEKENEQLKQSNQKLNDELQETMGYLALKSGVEKENEQLKQEIKDLQVKFRKFNNHMIGDVE